MSWESFIAVSDTHGDHIDRDFESYSLKWIEDHKPKHRWMLGDLFNCVPLRKGADAHDRAQGLKDDINAGLSYLRKLRPHRLCWGNHDHRLWLLADSGRESLEVDYAQMLRRRIDKEVDYLKIKAVEYDVELGWQEIAPGKKIGHGYISSLYVARQNCIHFKSTLSGHIHAFDYHAMDDLDRTESYTSGAGCVIKQEYNRTHKRRLKHCVGFLVGVINTKTGAWQVWPVKRDERTKTWLDPKMMT